MDKVKYTEAERRLIEPKPGTAAARARDLGVDLSLTVSNLRFTPHERVKRLDEFQHEMRFCVRPSFNQSTMVEIAQSLKRSLTSGLTVSLLAASPPARSVHPRSRSIWTFAILAIPII